MLQSEHFNFKMIQFTGGQEGFLVPHPKPKNVETSSAPKGKKSMPFGAENS